MRKQHDLAQFYNAVKKTLEEDTLNKNMYAIFQHALDQTVEQTVHHRDGSTSYKLRTTCTRDYVSRWIEQSRNFALRTANNIIEREDDKEMERYADYERAYALIEQILQEN